MYFVAASIAANLFNFGSERVDGHAFVRQALDQGATAVVVENETQINDSRVLRVHDTASELGRCASLFYGNPSHALAVTGITGTNGKTTTTYLIESILSTAAMPTGVIGTIANRIKTYVVPSTHTTPNAPDLQRLLAEFKKRGAVAAAIEVSSHALDQRRAVGTRFVATVFTNLTQDHLDYHGTIDAYFDAKARLFTEYETKYRVINNDDRFGRKLIDLCKMRGFNVTTFGRENSDVNTGKLHFDSHGIHGKLELFGSTIDLRCPLLGEFNAQNIAAAAAVAHHLGIPHSLIADALAKASVPGRMQAVTNAKQLNVVIDYAHTPDALEKALKCLRPFTKRLVCLFGCGGDRDKSKRSQMGAIAEQLSDKVFVTSDNPRTENPETIIEMIYSGFQSTKKITKIIDRREAINTAIATLKTDDILLIAGKGHEDYQIIGSVKHSFDDRRVAEEAIQLRK